MRNPAVQPVKLTTQRVSITAVDLSAGIAQARTTLGKEIQLRLDRRPKGGAAPAVGDIWTVCKEGYSWTLKAMLNAPATPTVTGSRAAADPVTLSLLAALVQLGLVQDGTTA